MSCYPTDQETQGSEMGHPELEAYYEALPELRERMIARETIRAAIPEGFEETMQYGMPSWVVPHQCIRRSRESELPFPFSRLAVRRPTSGCTTWESTPNPNCWTGSRLNIPSTVLPDWTWARAASVITPDRPPELLGELASRMSTQWIRLAETALHGRSS